MTTFHARAHTNIALIKYWGKRDDHLILPYNSSLSLTLNEFYTDTTVCFDAGLETDLVTMNGVLLDNKAQTKITEFLDLVRQKAQIQTFAQVTTDNHVPTSAGLASSASGYAALAGAASRAAGLHLSLQDLSRLARRGSGSAARSIYGDFVEWQRGTNDADSYAVPVAVDDWGLQMIAIVVNSNEKAIHSREGMATTVATSPYYTDWVKTAETDLIAMKQAIIKKDINLVGQIAEDNAMRMHATTLSASPSFTYFEPESLVAIAMVKRLRNAGYSCYYTMDAGPNVKVICPKTQTKAILAELAKTFNDTQLIVATAGPGITMNSVNSRKDMMF